MSQFDKSIPTSIPFLKNQTEIEENLMKSAHVIFDETFSHSRNEVLQKLIIDEHAVFWKSLLTAYKYNRVLSPIYHVFISPDLYRNTSF